MGGGVLGGEQGEGERRRRRGGLGLFCKGLRMGLPVRLFPGKKFLVDGSLIGFLYHTTGIFFGGGQVEGKNAITERQCIRQEGQTGHR